MIEHRSIGEAGNYYGGVLVTEQEGKFYWQIENYCTMLDEFYPEDWEQIPKELYDALNRFQDQNERPKMTEDQQ